ncbi:hypothetical protein MNEG_8729, partial [Monoraphidium neglectum]
QRALRSALRRVCDALWGGADAGGASSPAATLPPPSAAAAAAAVAALRSEVEAFEGRADDELANDVLSGGTFSSASPPPPLRLPAASPTSPAASAAGAAASALLPASTRAAVVDAADEDGADVSTTAALGGHALDGCGPASSCNDPGSSDPEGWVEIDSSSPRFGAARG